MTDVDGCLDHSFLSYSVLEMLSQDVVKNCHQRSIKVTWMAFGRPRKSTSLPSLPSEFTATSQTPSCPSSSSRPDGRNGFSRRDWCHEVSRFSALMNTCMYLYIYDNQYPYLYFYALWGNLRNLQFAILLLLPGMTWIKQRFFVVMASDW